jgi:hypothetical protein
MKKITFILFALIAGTTFAQTASETATANVGAEIIQPITITKNNDLNFGRIIGTSAGGTVNITEGGVRTSSATPDILDPSTGGIAAISASKFTITAAEDFSYGITIPATVTITGSGGDPMIVTLNPFYDGAALSGASPKGTDDKEILTVGGDLAVGTTQGQGAYTATFDVTVTYE